MLVAAVNKGGRIITTHTPLISQFQLNSNDAHQCKMSSCEVRVSLLLLPRCLWSVSDLPTGRLFIFCWGDKHKRSQIGENEIIEEIISAATGDSSSCCIKLVPINFKMSSHRWGNSSKLNVADVFAHSNTSGWSCLYEQECIVVCLSNLKHGDSRPKQRVKVFSVR